MNSEQNYRTGACMSGKAFDLTFRYIDDVLSINLCNQCLSPLTLWVRIPLWRAVLDTTLCHEICQWLAVGWWFSLGTPVSPPIKLTATI